jgi:hypothetical protein
MTSALPFAQWLPQIRSAGTDPSDLAQLQAHLSQVHRVISQIFSDSPLSRRALNRFPNIDKIENRTATEITRWWKSFFIWYRDLSARDFVLLNSIPVFPSVPQQSKALPRPPLDVER